MSDKENKNTNAPSSDSTPALFVSSRKKQLEEQETQRIAAEKEAQRLEAEAEVKRLEEEVRKRKIQAQEDAKRIELEAEQRKKEAELKRQEEERQEIEDAKRKEAELKQSEINAKKAAIEETAKKFQEGASASGKILQDKLSDMTSKISDKKPKEETQAKPPINKNIIIGGIVAVVAVVAVMLFGGSSGVSDEDLAGAWYSENNTVGVYFEDGMFTVSDFRSDVLSGTYEIDGDALTLYNGESVALTGNFDKNANQIVFAELDTVFDRDGMLEVSAEYFLGIIPGEWDIGETTLVFNPASSESGGIINVYVGSQHLEQSSYYINENKEIIATLLGDQYTFYYVNDDQIGSGDTMIPRISHDYY